MNLSPTSPVGWLLLDLRRRLELQRRDDAERGASAIEWVIITGVLVALAAAVGVIIFNLIRGEAQSIQIPDPPT
ncbi:MAG: hypothetical protein ACRDWI_17675 [Jiangellaceae bacterium]